MKQFWKAGLALAVLLAIAGAAVGIVSAQSGGDATSTPEASATDTPDTSKLGRPHIFEGYLAQLAENLGVSEDELKGTMKDTANELVDAAAADGTLTDEQATRLHDAINNGDFPPFGPGPGFGHGPGRHPFLAHNIVGNVADFLGISQEDVVTALMDDQSLAQIAEDHGKTRDELKAYLSDEFNQTVDDLVANKGLPQERADEMKQNFAGHLDDLIDHVGAPGPGKRGFIEPNGGFMMPGDVTPSDEGASTTF